MGAEVFTSLRWPPAQPRADAAQLSGRLCPARLPIAAAGFLPGWLPGWHQAAPVLGLVAGREARGRLAPVPVPPASASRSGKPQPKAPRGARIYRRGRGKQLRLPLAVVEQQRQINCGRPGPLPPPCPAPPYVCSSFAPFPVICALKRERDARLIASLPAHPSCGRASHAPRPRAHPAPSLPGPGTAFWPANSSPCGSHMCSHVSVPENKQQLWLRFNLTERQGCEGETFPKALPGHPSERHGLAGSSRPRTPREVDNLLFERKSS